MKKAIPIFLAVAMALLFLTVRASADEITGEYRIREEGEVYILEENRSGYVELGEYSSVSECFLYTVFIYQAREVCIET